MTEQVADATTEKETFRRLDRTLLWGATVGAWLVLALAAWVEPAPEGVGTHRQLGLPPCGMYVATGIPCPSCGMTTAFAHGVRGEVVTAFGVQPFGALLFCATLLVGIAAPVGLVRRQPVGFIFEAAGRRRYLLIGLALFLLAWIYKLVGSLMAGS